jgi:DnaK suppressor protein
MNKKNLTKIKDELLLQKKALILKANQRVDIDTDGDEVDVVQGNVILELASQLSTRDILKINQIDDALLKIQDRTYGICEDCEEDIPDKRLLANPYFLTCVSCAEDRENKEKQRKRT